jgi:alpha-D-xyloside xylohydrolase
MKSLAWTAKAAGVWSTVIGAPKGLTPLSFVSAEPRSETLKRMGEAPFPFDESEFELEGIGGKLILRHPLTDREKVYGMGLQFLRMNQRGRTRFLRVASDPKQDTGESHAPVPFYVTDRGYGILIDTARIVTIYCGSAVCLEDTRPEETFDRNTERGWRATPLSRKVEIVLPAEGAEVFVFAGCSVLEAVRRYNLYCGGGTLPPRWGLGFWHRVPKLYDAEEAYAEAMEFRERDFPCDVIGLEPGWHSKSYPVTYEWSRERFPDPSAFVAQMGAEGFRVNLWEHPYVSADAGIYEALRPLSGSHSVWGGLAPDYALPEARALYREQHEREHVGIGVAGYKLDECDGSELTGHSWMFPAHARFPSGHDGEQIRQLYGLMFQKMSEEMYRKIGRRTYGLVRASGAGAAPLPFVLYSDLYDHRQFIRALCNSTFCGLLWTPEVRKAKDAEDWVRRMQSVVFSPMAMLNAWGDGTKPWSFPEAEGIVRRYIQLRMRLLPYLYSAFARYHFEGIPPFMAMPLSSGAQAKLQTQSQIQSNQIDTGEGAYGRTKEKEWDDQYFVGESLLVAPLFAGEASREVLLPEGIWYRLHTGERLAGGRVVRVEAGLEEIPVFVRDGSVIPMMAALPHAPRSGQTADLDIYHFGESSGSFRLYDDDGESFAYEKGEFRWREITVDRSEDGSFVGRILTLAEDDHANEPGRNEKDFRSSYAEVRWHFQLTRWPDGETKV